MKFSGLIGFPGMRCLRINPYTQDVLTPAWPTGLIIPFIDDYWGGGELIYAQAEAAIAVWECCYYRTANEFFVADTGRTQQRMQVRTAPVPTTMSNNGQPVCIALENMASGDFGWFLVTATAVPVRATALHSGGVLVYRGSATPGRVTTISQPGGQIIRARNCASGSGANSALCTRGYVGRNFFEVRNNSQIFLNHFVSGTGIPAGSIVTGCLDDDHTVFISNNLTADPAGTTVSFPLNDGSTFFPFISMNRSCIRGPTT